MFEAQQRQIIKIKKLGAITAGNTAYQKVATQNLKCNINYTCSTIGVAGFLIGGGGGIP